MAHFRFLALPIKLSHALRVASLPAINDDPFDRLLVAQSEMESLPILTADPEIARYPVAVLW
jgi:PIN domain nuclease of toxin-antitoxin system